MGRRSRKRATLALDVAATTLGIDVESEAELIDELESLKPRAPIMAGRVDVIDNESRHHHERIHDLADEWVDEASQAAVAGRPRRAFYLQHMADMLRCSSDAQVQIAAAVSKARLGR